MVADSGEHSAPRGEMLIREAFETAKGFDWDLEADDILGRVRRPDRQVRRRVEVVLVTVLILVVFFAPLPGINLFHRLQGHNGISPTGPSTVPTTPRQTNTAVLSSGTLAYISPVGEQTAWAVVDTSDGGEHVLRTVDGGTSWADVTPSQLAALVTPTNVGNGASTPQVIFLGAERAWTAAAGKLVATDDGGASWRDVAALPPSCVPVQFVDPSHGWCNASFVGQGMSSTVDLYRTVDGGRRWQHVQSVDLPNSANKGELPYECGKSFRFTTPSVGWAGLSCGGYVGQVYETTDGGAHWTARTISTPSSLAKAEVLMMPPIFVGKLGAGVMSVNAGDTVMYYSDDGGRSWHTVVPPGGLQAWGVDLISPLQWRLVNAKSILSTSDGGRTWQSLTPRWPFPLGNPEKYGVPNIQFVTASIGWGQFWDSKTGTNTLWRTTDGGDHWTAVLPLAFNGVAVASSTGQVKMVNLSKIDRYESITVANDRIVLSGPTSPSPAASASSTCSSAVVNPTTLALSNMKSGRCADPALFGRSVIPTISLDKNLPAGDGGPSEVVRIAHVTSGSTGYALGPIVMTFSALAYDQTEPSWIYGGGDLWLYDWTDHFDLLRISTMTGAVLQRLSIPKIQTPLLAFNDDGLWIAPTGESTSPLYRLTPGATSVSAVFHFGAGGFALWLVASGDTVWLEAQPRPVSRTATIWALRGPDATPIWQRSATAVTELAVGTPKTVGDGADGLWTAYVTLSPPRQRILRLNPATGTVAAVATIDPGYPTAPARARRGGPGGMDGNSVRRLALPA